MPKAPSAETVRERAHHRALATVAAIEKPVRSETELDSAVGLTGEHAVMESASLCICDTPGHADDCPAKAGWQQKLETLKQEEPPLPETDQVHLESATDNHQDEVVQQKPMGRPKAIKESTHRGVDEDFFEYLARIDPKDWSSVQTSGLYIYKLQSGGNLRIGPVLRKAITFDELKDIAIKHGPGNYKVQFQTRLQHLTKCGEVVPFDADSLPESASQRQGSSQEMKGFDKAIEASSNMLEHSAKTAIDLHKEVQVQNNKAPDTAGLITAIGTLMAGLRQPEPKEDKTVSLIMTMLQNQAVEAQRRADDAEKRAMEQRRLDREDAERRERQAKEDAQAARERDKQFFELMLKQAETKADSLNSMTGLLTSFMKVKEAIDDTTGGGPKGPWDLAGNVIDGVLQQGPAIVAALKGAPPQQLAQMQNPQAQQVNPQQQMFLDFVARLDRYFQRDKYDGIYLHDMIEIEYGQIYVDIKNMPKETVLEAIKTNGGAFMENPKASEFMAKIVDAIKEPDTMDDIFPEEPEEKEPIVLHGKARKVNGKAKNA